MALIDSAEPGPDRAKLAHVQRLCSALKGHDTYITEKASEVASHAARFFSARDFDTYTGGWKMLRAKMGFDLVGRIRSRIATRQAGQ